MRDGNLTVEQYFSKFQECLRLSGKHMSTEDKIETLKDGLRPDIRKLLAFSDFDTVADLKQAAQEIEKLDEEKTYQEEILRSASQERSLQGQERKRPST
jgi:hypothetical protein